MTYAGHTEKALAVMRRAMRLNPFHPAFWLGSVGHAYLIPRRYAEALGPLRAAVGQAPRYWPGLGWLAEACVNLGLIEDYRDAVAALQEIEPNVTLATWECMVSYRTEVDQIHVLGSRRMAGMAE